MFTEMVNHEKVSLRAEAKSESIILAVLAKHFALQRIHCVDPFSQVNLVVTVWGRGILVLCCRRVWARPSKPDQFCCTARLTFRFNSYVYLDLKAILTNICTFRSASPLKNQNNHRDVLNVPRQILSQGSTLVLSYRYSTTVLPSSSAVVSLWDNHLVLAKHFNLWRSTIDDMHEIYWGRCLGIHALLVSGFVLLVIILLVQSSHGIPMGFTLSMYCNT